MKKVIAFLVGVALLSGVSGAWAQQASNSGVVATATAVGLDGKPIQAIEFAFTDTWRQNRYYSVTQTLQSDQLRFPGKPWNAKTNPYEVKAVTVATSNMSGNGLGRDAAVGFIGNLPNAGGLIGGAALLRPSQTVQNNGGGNATQSQGQGQHQRQGQGQLQGQQQGQNQVAAPVNVNNNTNVNTPIANAAQAQGQSTGPFSPVTAVAP